MHSELHDVSQKYSKPKLADCNADRKWYHKLFLITFERRLHVATKTEYLVYRTLLGMHPFLVVSSFLMVVYYFIFFRILPAFFQMLL